jgi:Contractile injection system tube protein
MATSPDFPRSLEPKQIALPVPLLRGALISLPDPRAKNTTTYQILRFQYNPDTVTRARTGQWERKLDKKTAKAAQQKAADDAARGGAIKSKSEVVSFKLVFDAAELLLRDAAAASKGVMPELSMLERFALGPDQIPDPPKKDNEFALITLAPTEAILVLGPRKFPGVITQMNIVEHRYTPELVPIRAEVDIRFRVLEATAVIVSKDTQKIFDDLLKQREQLSGEAVATGTGDVYEAIGKAIVPRALP